MRPQAWLLVAPVFALGSGAAVAQSCTSTGSGFVRIATFNASMFRPNAGALSAALASGTDPQIKAVAAILQNVRPDAVLLNEFDYEPTAPAAFLTNYLAVSQGEGLEPLSFTDTFIAPSNTGVATGLDLDNNGSVGGPGDAQGFGFFEGQYGMAVLSQLPIDHDGVRTFQTFLWSAMPDNRLAAITGPDQYYSTEEAAVLRLSSKSHWDVPVLVGDHAIHLLTSHPTPPVFDGPEDRNGRHNADEIRFWTDYVGGAEYMADDRGQSGGLAADASFVILGDLNADPKDGDGIRAVIADLLAAPRVHDTMPTSTGAVEAAAQQGGKNAAHAGPAETDTADFADTRDFDPGNLRADYALPSADLTIVASGVFWPAAGEPGHALLTLPDGTQVSDHHLTYVDIGCP